MEWYTIYQKEKKIMTCPIKPFLGNSCSSQIIVNFLRNPVPLPDLYFDSFSYPVASIVFGDMAIGLLFLLLFFFSSQSQILTRKVQARSTFWLNIVERDTAESSTVLIFSFSLRKWEKYVFFFFNFKLVETRIQTGFLGVLRYDKA